MGQTTESPEQVKAYRVCFDSGDEITVEAPNPDEAERLTRRYLHVSDCGWGSDPIGAVWRDRGKAWSIIDLEEFPDPS